MGKGEIAHYEQFLIFPQCFQKACVPGASKGVIVWEWVKSHSVTALVITIIISGCGHCKRMKPAFGEAATALSISGVCNELLLIVQILLVESIKSVTDIETDTHLPISVRF